MGCYAAFPALRMAEQFCQADPAATVLWFALNFARSTCKARMTSTPWSPIQCLPTVWPPFSSRRNHPLKAGAAIPSTVLLPASPGRASRTWRGTSGIRASTSCSPNTSPGLSAQTSSTSWMMPFRAARELQNSILTWAIHPGGRAILDKIESSLALRPEQVPSVPRRPRRIRKHEQRDDSVRPGRNPPISRYHAREQHLRDGFWPGSHHRNRDS